MPFFPVLSLCLLVYSPHHSYQIRQRHVSVLRDDAGVRSRYVAMETRKVTLSPLSLQMPVDHPFTKLCTFSLETLLLVCHHCLATREHYWPWNKRPTDHNENKKQNDFIKLALMHPNIKNQQLMISWQTAAQPSHLFEEALFQFAHHS